MYIYTVFTQHPGGRPAQPTMGYTLGIYPRRLGVAPPQISKLLFCPGPLGRWIMDHPHSLARLSTSPDKSPAMNGLYHALCTLNSYSLLRRLMLEICCQPTIEPLLASAADKPKCSSKSGTWGKKRK